MTKRGKMHQWYISDQGPVCSRCGAHGEKEIFFRLREAGWRGKPTYECKDKTDD